MRRRLVGIAGVAALAGMIALGGGCRARPGSEMRRSDAGRGGGQIGAFFRCLTASEIDVGGIANGQQVRRLVESAYDRLGAAFVARIRGTCLPLLAGARTGADAGAIARLEAAVGEYAGRMGAWRREDGDEDGDEDEDEDEDGDEDGDGDGAIVRSARAWNGARGGTSLSRRALAYDRFLGCVVPDLGRLRDDQALYQRLASSCFGGDLTAFVARVRSSCVPLLTKKTPPEDPRGPLARQRRFRDSHVYNSAGRHAALWSQCLELAEEQRRLRDGEALVSAVDALLAARPRD